MYRCNECKCKFEEPCKMNIASFYGIDEIQTTEKIDVCPNCKNNDFEEIEENYEEL